MTQLHYISGSGPQPATVALYGERPGKEEARTGRCFVGKSGRELDRYLLQGSVRRDECFISNVCQDYLLNDPDPEQWELDRDWERVVAELRKVKPKYVGLVGRFAARQFVGLGLELEWGHGMAHRVTLGEGLPSMWVMPLYHPSYALHQPRVAPLVWDDFQRFCQMVKQGPEGLELPVDNYLRPQYQLVTDKFPIFLTDAPIYMDTEGSVEAPWGLSFTQREGEGWVVRANNTAMLKRLGAVIKKLDLEVVCHHVFHDVGVLRAMGIEGYRFRCTMHRAYHLGLLPQGLKPLSRRLSGAAQRDYQDVVGNAGKEKALEYLLEALEWANNRWPVELKVRTKRKTQGKGGRLSRKICPRNAAR